MAIWLRLPPSRAIIVPTENLLGSVTHRHKPIRKAELTPDIDVTPAVRDRFERHVLVSMAGHEAEARHARSQGWRVLRHGAHQDEENVLALLERLEYFGDLATYHRLLRSRLLRVLDGNWANVEAVATDLLTRKTLTGKQLRESFLRAVQTRMEQARQARKEVIAGPDALLSDSPGSA